MLGILPDTGRFLERKAIAYFFAKMNNEKKNAIKDAANDVRNLIEKFSAKRYKEKPSEELQADLVITLDIFHKELTSKLMADMPKKLIKKIEERRKKL